LTEHCGASRETRERRKQYDNGALFHSSLPRSSGTVWLVEPAANPARPVLISPFLTGLKTATKVSTGNTRTARRPKPLIRRRSTPDSYSNTNLELTPSIANLLEPY
jgi:hypothetical protein